MSKTVTVEGTAIQLGGQVFDHLVLPIIGQALPMVEEEDRARFMAGVLSALLGMMAADLGYDATRVVARKTLDMFEDMRERLEAQRGSVQ